MIPGWQERIEEAQEQTDEEIQGKVYQRVRYGDDYDFPVKDRCWDCAVEVGQLHVPGCCVERCPRCRDQAIGCDCLLDDPEVH